MALVSRADAVDRDYRLAGLAPRWRRGSHRLGVDDPTVEPIDVAEKPGGEEGRALCGERIPHHVLELIVADQPVGIRQRLIHRVPVERIWTDGEAIRPAAPVV